MKKQEIPTQSINQSLFVILGGMLMAGGSFGIVMGLFFAKGFYLKLAIVLFSFAWMYIGADIIRRNRGKKE